MDDKKIILKRKRSDEYKNNSLDCLHPEKYFKEEKQSPRKKRFISSGNKKNYAYNDSYSNNKSKFIYPNHYWFGGNMQDPLNLNGLMDSGGMSHSVTPLPSPPSSPHKHDFLVPVAHAVNIYDPLNLCGQEDDALFFKKRNRTRKRKHSTKKRSKSRLNSLSDEANEGNLSTGSETKILEDLSKLKNSSFKKDVSKIEINNSISNTILFDSSNLTHSLKKEIVPHLTSHIQTHKDSQDKNFETSFMPFDKPLSKKSNNKSIEYRYGNYNNHRSYMNEDYMDARLGALPRRAFENKVVLDIGCGVGHSTILIAKNFEVKHITGIDVDARLIKAASKNLLYHTALYNDSSTNDLQNQNSLSSPIKIILNPSKINLSPSKLTSYKHLKVTLNRSNHQQNMRYMYGSSVLHPLINITPTSSLSQQSSQEQSYTKFPHNITFNHEDYAPVSSLEVSHQKPLYDVIMALALTKHIHLNHGDLGLQLFFKKVYQQLKPGGSFILQAQQWSSYKKHNKASDTIANNYKNIKFFPTQFEEYLMSNNVGFVHCNHIADIRLPHKTKACQQFILEFIKRSTDDTVPYVTTVIPTSKQIQPDTTNKDAACSVISNIDSSSQINKLENSSSSASKVSGDHSESFYVSSNCKEINSRCDSENFILNENSNSMSIKSCSGITFNSGDGGLCNDISNSPLV